MDDTLKLHIIVILINFLCLHLSNMVLIKNKDFKHVLNFILVELLYILVSLIFYLSKLCLFIFTLSSYCVDELIRH